MKNAFLNPIRRIKIPICQVRIFICHKFAHYCVRQFKQLHVLSHSILYEIDNYCSYFRILHNQFPSFDIFQPVIICPLPLTSLNQLEMRVCN